MGPWLYNHMIDNEGAQRIRGVSFLSYFGDHLYDNAPYQTVNEDNLALWEALSKLEFSKDELFKVAGASPDLAQDPACSGGGCLLK